MRIKTLNLRNIRNHIDSDFEFCEFLNILCGQNGAGKTSVLEAIALAGLSKSFLPVTDSILTYKDAENYRIKLNATNDLTLPYFVSINYSKTEKKEISNTYGDNLIPKDIIGKLPIVVLSPDYKEITFGSPQCRRTLMDRILSQSFSNYLDNWLKLKKILRHRSILLANNLRTHDLDHSLLEVWTNMLVEVSAEITWRRAEFIKKFDEKFRTIYAEISQNKEEVELKYRAFGIKDTSSKDNIFQELTKVASYYLEDEIRRGVNLFGPQRDDLKILINGGIARDFASQGQHKSLLIAIKFAEFHFLHEALNETPIIILDDIFSELDSERIAQVLNLVKLHNAQTFISVNYVDFLEKIQLTDRYKIFNIFDGKVISAEEFNA